MRSRSEAKEELTTVGTRSSVGHGKHTACSVLLDEVFVSKFLAIDWLTTCTIMVSEITTLSHKARNDAMEDGFLEAELLARFLSFSLLTSAQSTEVLCSLRSLIKEVNNQAASRFAIDMDVHIDGRVGTSFGLHLLFSWLANGELRIIWILLVKERRRVISRCLSFILLIIGVLLDDNLFEGVFFSINLDNFFLSWTFGVVFLLLIFFG